MPEASTRAATLTTTEAAVLALLAIEGERSPYELTRLAERAIAYVWAPAKTHLYALLPRLERDGLVAGRAVRQAPRPDKRIYALTPAGREALRAWHETVEPGSVESFQLRLFVGGLTTDDVLAAHVEQFRADTQARLDELLAVEPTNSRRGHDRYHGFLLDLGIERHRSLLAWCDAVLSELRG
jgi:DNA-binding PadR family transcriptional regulator